jgi:hypothetical protein
MSFNSISVTENDVHTCNHRQKVAGVSLEKRGVRVHWLGFFHVLQVKIWSWMTVPSCSEMGTVLKYINKKGIKDSEK